MGLSSAGQALDRRPARRRAAYPWPQRTAALGVRADEAIRPERLRRCPALSLRTQQKGQYEVGANQTAAAERTGRAASDAHESRNAACGNPRWRTLLRLARRPKPEMLTAFNLPNAHLKLWVRENDSWPARIAY